MQWAVGNVNYPRKKLSLSKEEAVPGGASVRYSPCKHSGHLSAWASWNSKICRLFVLEEVSIFSKGVLIQTTPVPATLAASSCLHVGPCFIRMLLFLPGYFSFRPVWWSGFVTSLCCSKVAGKHRESGTLELLPGRVWLKDWGLFFPSHLGERLFMHEVSIWQSFHLKSSLYGECLSAPM